MFQVSPLNGKQHWDRRAADPSMDLKGKSPQKIWRGGGSGYPPDGGKADEKRT
jgi:hypothetical protein